MDAKVSIIVPVYNAAQYLEECIESIINQDYPQIELILVNDGSKDNSLEICRRYESDKVIVINKINEGVSKARNDGIDAATGEYISFVDADDTLPSNCLSILVNAIKNSNSDMAYGSYFHNYAGRLVVHHHRLAPGVYNTKELLSKLIDDGTLSGFLLGSVWGGLYKKIIIEKNCISFNPEIKLNEDGLFNFEYALNADSLVVVNDAIYYYREYSLSSSKTKGKYLKYYNQRISDYLLSLKWEKEKNCFDKQIKARNASIAFWEIMSISQGYSILKGTRMIRELLNNSDVKEGIKSLDLPNMNKYKRGLSSLMKYNKAFALCFLLKYIYPVASKFIER